jgi:uncharacterized surface protein with fasciclin (FAS1) repeats
LAAFGTKPGLVWGRRILWAEGKIGASGMPFRADTSLVSVEGNQPNRARSVAESALASSKNHMKILRLNIATFIASFTAAAVFAMENPMVGGAPMLPTKNVIQNAINSKDHTTLVTAIKAATLVQTLEGKGPFTVFAPTNEAFEKLPAGTVEMLLKPENKEKLAGILMYHVVAGKMTADELAKEIKAGNGAA